MTKRIILIANAVIRKKDLIYYVDRDGNLCAAQKRKGRRPGSKNKRHSKKSSYDGFDNTEEY